MKKALFFVIFIFFALALTMAVNEPKKIYKLKKAYVYLDESLLISETDLNCSYFVKDSMPQDIQVVAAYQRDDERKSFLDYDNLFIDKGANDGLKVGDVLQIISQGKRIGSLGRYYLKESLAEITNIYENRSIIQLKNGCHPVHLGDFAVPFKPEKTLFAKKIDYQLARIPESPVNGHIMYLDLTSHSSASITSTSNYVTIDLGEGVVARGSLLLIYRVLKRDLPPLIIGLGIVIHAEKTNSTMKILDANSDIQISDQVLLLPAEKEIGAVAPGGEGDENIPIVETLQAEKTDMEDVPVAEQKDETLTVDVFFEFDSRQPKGDHSGDFATIRDFINAKSEYLITLRGYTCSIGSEEYNLRLAKERVDTIKDILISQYGADSAHVESFFYGEREANFDNSSEAERMKNRLVKIEVSGK
ncbi:MAG: OmpA family protein [Candidatus Aminicenantes bacterium]|nr:OmpA family protein [Candidatus Aminicenantes bacterium]